MKFDDVITDETGSWTELCKKHKDAAEELELGVSSENAAEMICGCEGCSETAEYYFDFDKKPED
jgi:hypothetical protein